VFSGSIQGHLKGMKPRGTFEMKEIAIYVANETKYIKIILCCINIRHISIITKQSIQGHCLIK